MSDQVDESGEVLTLREAQAVYNVGRATLYRYVQQGRLQPLRRGMDRRTYLRRVELDRLREVAPVNVSAATNERVRRFLALEERAAAIRAGVASPASVVGTIEAARRERDEERDEERR